MTCTEATFHVAGIPATFATAREAAWKAALRGGIPDPSMSGQETGLTARFVLPTMAPAGQPLDIDNLCEPLLSVLVNQVGWFGAARPNITWWSASKEEGTSPGCYVTLSDATGPPLRSEPVVFSGLYSGALPRGGREAGPAEWCRGLLRGGAALPADVSLGCSLAFGSSRINLGDISSGVIKSTIDCLYPVWGGSAGSPDDHRIDVLTLTKAATGVPTDAVAVSVWALARRVARGQTRQDIPPGGHVRKATDAVTHPPSEVGLNPCRPGTAKHVVCEAAMAGWSLERIRNSLEELKPGSSQRLSEYIADLRSENRLDVGQSNGAMWYRGEIARR